MSVKRSCAPGCGRSLRTISRVPSGYNGIAAHAGSYFERVRTEQHTVGAVDTGIVSKAFPVAEVQYRYSACNRLAQTDFQAKPPFDRYLRPGAEWFLYLQGTNASFRRGGLVEPAPTARIPP